MNADLHINSETYGQPSDLANSLVLEIEAKGISCYEMDAAQYLPLFVSHYAIGQGSENLLGEHIHQAFRYFKWHQKKYESTYINYFSPQFTLCPSHFYDSNHNRNLLEFNVGPIGDKFVLVDDIDADVKLLYAMDDNLKSTLDLLLPNHQLKHSLTVLSKLMLQSDELQKDDILLCVNAHYIEVVYKQQHQLVLANQFTVKTQEDILYYVLFLLEQYQLNPSTVSVCVIGNIDSQSTLLITLKKYIKKIRLARGHKSLNWKNLTGMPQHFNYTLLNRLFCES